MEIKAIDVKKLREETNAGMMDCKKALLESDGDFEKAKLSRGVEILNTEIIFKSWKLRKKYNHRPILNPRKI